MKQISYTPGPLPSQRDDTGAAAGIPGRYGLIGVSAGGWRSNGGRYLLLVNVTRRYLSAALTSVPSEWLFSTASNVCSDKRSYLSSENVERLVFLKANYSFWLLSRLSEFLLYHWTFVVDTWTLSIRILALLSLITRVLSFAVLCLTIRIRTVFEPNWH